jgi:hypothetical protein
VTGTVLILCNLFRGVCRAWRTTARPSASAVTPIGRARVTSRTAGGIQHGPLRRHRHDRRDHHPVEGKLITHAFEGAMRSTVVLLHDATPAPIRDFK